MLYVLPLMNPDGYTATQRYNANGVDLNRNFYTSAFPFGESPSQCWRRSVPCALPGMGCFVPTWCPGLRALHMAVPPHPVPLFLTSLQPPGPPGAAPRFAPATVRPTLLPAH